MALIDFPMVSRRPWGEARLGYQGEVLLEHFNLQVMSDGDAVRLAAALRGVSRLGETTLDTVPSGTEDMIAHSMQMGMLAAYDGKMASVSTANVTPSGPPPASVPILCSLRFSLRPQANADGTITLGFAPNGAFTDVANVRSGKTVALIGLSGLLGLFDGWHPSGKELVAFVTPTVL